MPDSSNKTKQLKPSWKFYFWCYFFGVLTVPLLLGIVLLAKAIRKKNRYRYIIEDETITAEDGDYSQKFDLVNVEDVQVEQTWIQQKLGVGLVRISKEGSEMELFGIENPHSFKEMILAVSSNLKAMQQKKPETKEPVEKPSIQTDKMDYLTGLWQQGLLTDEDYKTEKKHFEN